MIKSAIFDAYTNYMPQIRTLLLSVTLLSLPLAVFSQYTETINSNRPGASQGAFAVGRQIIQAEVGADYGNDTHDLRLTDTDIFGINLALRYGLLWEQLEINANIRYQVNQVGFTDGNRSIRTLNGLETTQIGAKYLIYDPYKYQNDEPNLYSYHANIGFKWHDLIPAVSAYAAAVFDFTVDPFRADIAAGSGILLEQGISPNVAIITQNNWGRWVWVNNIIGDRITTEIPSYIWITTMTHSFNPRISGFLEYQLVDGDLYSDNIVRLGGAYLINRNLQVDVSGLINFKDTPSRWNVGLGLSYRLDLHDYDEVLETKENQKGSAQRQSDRINKKYKKKKKRKDAIDPQGEDGEGGGN